MARNTRRFIHGPLHFRDGVVFPTRRVIEEFATVTDDKTLRKAARELQRASQFYVSHRDSHVAPQVVRAQLKAIVHPISQLEAKLRDLPPITYSQLDSAMGGASGHSRRMANLVRQLSAGLPALVEEGSGAGKDPDDPPGNQYVQDLLNVFMAITGRTSPPSVKFNAAAESVSRDDVSSSTFGRFVVAVEGAVIDEMSHVLGARRLGYRIENKRASIREALKRARPTRSL